MGSGVICVVVTDPGEPGQPGSPGEPGDGGQAPAGCYKSDGTQVPCQTNDGYWWSGYQCYAAPYDAPPGAPAWQGHTDGSLWQCTRCETAGTSTTCNVQIIWTAPGEEPGPPTPEQLATTALDQLPLAQAEVHTAPAPPAATYVGVENWLWVPNDQWRTLTKSVNAGATTVTVTAAPSQIVWNLGPSSITCYDPGKPWEQGMSDVATTTCGYTYETTSVDQPDGSFAISATIRYQVTWTCAGACPTAGGDLGLVDAPAGTSTLRVLQRQTVVVR
ncbi:MAG: hypothetical protein LT071_14385 [Nocardioides sp.]|nr:hypothetical protein [Nocardioides sp.]